MVLTRRKRMRSEIPLGSPTLCLEHIFYGSESPGSWGWFIYRRSFRP